MTHLPRRTTRMIELYFDDLKPEAQKRFLAASGLTSAAAGNYDVLPIVFLPVDRNDEEGE